MLTTKYDQILKYQLACLNASVSKDETRRNICGLVHHNSELKKLVSTDGHVMTLLGSMYDERLKGLSIDVKEFRVIDREFPRVNMFDISESLDKFESVEVTFSKQYGVKSKSLVRVFIKHDGTLTFDQPSDYVCAVDSKFLIPLKDGTFKCYFKKGEDSKLSAFYVCLNPSKSIDWYVVMPVKV